MSWTCQKISSENRQNRGRVTSCGHEVDTNRYYTVRGIFFYHCWPPVPPRMDRKSRFSTHSGGEPRVKNGIKRFLASCSIGWCRSRVRSLSPDPCFVRFSWMIFDMFRTFSWSAHKTLDGQNHTFWKCIEVGTPFFGKISLRRIGWWYSYPKRNLFDLSYEPKTVEV